LNKGGLFKTIRFKKPAYIGDPINSVKIFNEKESDELILLDFTATVEKRSPDFKKINEIAGEAFMPMAYGGAIRSLDDAKKVFDAGFEKVVLNSILFESPGLINEIASIYGEQAVVCSIDVKKNWLGRTKVFSHAATVDRAVAPAAWAKQLEGLGAGEIFLNAVDRDGTWEGYDLELIKSVSQSVSIPVVACGGASNVEDFRKAVQAGASAVAAGSMFVYQKKGMGVLISFPAAGVNV
jgi:cyclase